MASEVTTERLVKITTLAVRCRSAVERDGYSREVQLIPEPEAPARLALVLLRLLNGLQAIGVDEATAWHLVTKCALDSMPALRRAVIEELMARTTSATTTEIAEAIRYPTTTTRRALEDLAAHGVLLRLPQGPGRADAWQPSEWARARWPTVPEMSGDFGDTSASVPEMSGDMRYEHENGAGGAPNSFSFRIDDDISGMVHTASDESEAEILEQLQLEARP